MTPAVTTTPERFPMSAVAAVRTDPLDDLGPQPDPDEFVRAAMAWHFDPRTGSPFWLARARTLDFDPRRDVRGRRDLGLFPDVTAELRHARAEELVPRGYGDRPPVVGTYESGGTTGAPKRVVLLQDWLDLVVGWGEQELDRHGFPRGVNWLGVVPSGPHLVGELFARTARSHGAQGFRVDLDPRWVKSLIARGQRDQADAYAEHVVDQAELVLRSQDVGVLVTTPPLLERMARREALIDLINERVAAVRWGGTRLDPDSRHLYRTEVFPDLAFCGNYGSTMMLGFASERPGLDDDEPCTFDAFSPYVTFDVVDPADRRPVAVGARGQVVVHHVSRSFLLPNNLERDTAVRVAPPPGGAGDSVGDIAPVAVFEHEVVIEGVY